MYKRQPQKGAVYYDGKDLTTLELKSVRRAMGTVMQNDKLFQGDIFSNITICAPWLNMDADWEAAELAGIAQDIRDMPMGMHTVISEGSGGISGGQRQRLMIARAIAPKPRILIFDEATSALENLTQNKVSESLDSLKSVSYTHLDVYKRQNMGWSTPNRDRAAPPSPPGRRPAAASPPAAA